MAMNTTGIEGFCGGKFWDWELTWYTDNPELTPCFQNTALLWFTCSFLWIFSIWEIHCLIHSKQRDIPWNLLNISKCVISTLLLMTQVAALLHIMSVRNYSYNEVYAVDLYTPVIRLLTLLLALFLMVAGKWRGMRTSGILFTFWLFMTLTGAVTYRTLLNNAFQEGVHQAESPFITYMVFYPLVVAMFLLNCWADAEPRLSLVGEKPEKPHPELSASYLSRITFSWVDRVIWTGYKRPLCMDDMWELKERDQTQIAYDKLNRHWQNALAKFERESGIAVGYTTSCTKGDSNHVKFSGARGDQQKIVSILPPLWSAYGLAFLCGSVLRLIQDTMTFANPQILKLLIEYVESGGPTWRGIFYASLMVCVTSIQTITNSQYFLHMSTLGARVRAAVTSAIYRKVLRMSNAARKESTVGEIVNLMAVDTFKLREVTMQLNVIWTAVYMIMLAMYFLWQILGPSVLSGFAVMILAIPFNGLMVKKAKAYHMAQMKLKDKRVKLMNELLSGIKVLKLYAWEPSFEEHVLNIRKQEILVLRKAAIMDAGVAFLWTCAPYLVTLASFATYVLVDETHVLDASTVFVSLSLFNIMKQPMVSMPTFIISAVQGYVSIKRINKFMNSQELDPDAVTHDLKEDEAIRIEDGTFSWAREYGDTLSNIQWEVKKGSLAAVVGTVGSGKSSLLSAVLGDLEKLNGRVNIKGRVAYASQQAWIQNATLRDNILFGKTLDKTMYDKIIEACALTQDLEMLPAGDHTEIGEKGINLSGGQKQRVSLARAVYSDADLYLMDDPLSAVDSHVGKHIFEKVIGPQGLLKNKTRVLVTHGITFLPQMDQVMVLKNGRVHEIGSYKELLQKKGEFANFIMTHLTEADEDLGENEDLNEIKEQLMSTIGVDEFKRQFSKQKSRTSESRSDTSSLNDGIKPDRQASTRSLERMVSSLSQDKNGQFDSKRSKPKSDGKLIDTETSETEAVKLDVYFYYIKAIGLWMTIWTLILNVVYQGFAIGSNIWLSIWSDQNVQGTQEAQSRDLFLGIYGSLGIGQAIAMLGAQIILALGMLHGASVIHWRMLNTILHCPMSFFDTTPIGRIVNRFGKDIDMADTTLPQNFRNWLSCVFSVISILVVISYSTPIFTAVILPIGIVYYIMQYLFLQSARQLQRLESVTRSPLYSHFTETITGTSTIRAFGQQERFIRENDIRMDINQTYFHARVYSNRWLGIRLEFVGSMILFLATLFAVLGRDTLNPGLVGLSVSFAMQISFALSLLVRMTSYMETNVVAVERVKEYSEVLQEAPWERSNVQLPKGWPMEGRVEFDNYATRYREGLDLVLKGISCVVEGGEKVGIVGRTGAGKSSLTLALLRIIEGAGGRILIDGEEIGRLGLHQVRGRLTIIPQDPVLFSGTLRLNLDPFNTYTDQQVWEALQHAHLKAYVKSLSAGLQHEVSEGGENLSVGQRQLLCLARALLRKTKVLILDEATAAVDLETDDLIQKTIRSEFKDCTVITIAHRLNTIMDSNRVLVLDNGQISEYDSPSKLLASKKSVFYSMARDAGLVSNY